MSLHRRTVAEIHLGHLRDNFLWIKNNFTPDLFLCPMVKANAYGHGDLRVALALEKSGAQHFGVCLLEEALRLKSVGVRGKILVFGGFDQEGAKVIVEEGLVPVVSQWSHLDFLEQASSSKPVPLHLKFDTGMQRLGFSVKESQKLYDRLWQNKKLRLQGVLTHLHSAENFLNPQGSTQKQLDELHKIERVFKVFTPLTHALNSSAIMGSVLNGTGPRLTTGLRPGLMLYGYCPEFVNPSGETKSSLVERFSQEKRNIKPVMTLKSQIMDIKDLSKGSGVSYSHTWHSSQDTRLAIIPLGYGDGWHRLLSNKAQVMIRGDLFPIVGNICMDYLMVNLGAHPRGALIQLQDEVIFFGYEKSQQKFYGADTIAEQAQTITWEILTSITERVPRIYVESVEDQT